MSDEIFELLSSAIPTCSHDFTEASPLTMETLRAAAEDRGYQRSGLPPTEAELEVARVHWACVDARRRIEQEIAVSGQAYVDIGYSGITITWPDLSESEVWCRR